jgi:outer membrane protein assembly factor BamA
LASGRVSDALDTRTAYAADFAEGDRTLLWFELAGAYDTRDSLHNPYSGWHVGASARTTLAQSGGDTGAIFELSGSKVFTIPPLFHVGGNGEEHPPTDSLAFGAFTSSTAGDLPFYALPSLGGSTTLRGYINNRWTDRTAWHAGAEYRFWFVPRGVSVTETVRIERIGAAIFYEVGSVASHWTNLFDDTPRYSYGTSLRISLERTALFRLDLGFSAEDTNFSIAYGLTF